jgi:lysophospholipase L1-like esterase
MDFFSRKGKDYVTENYFMNLPAGVYEAYPDGQHDNTHFQPAGAKKVARMVFEGLKQINSNKLN